MKRNNGGSMLNLHCDELHHNPFDRTRQMKMYDENFDLPEEGNYFDQPVWKDDKLQQMKDTLNRVKSKIDHLNPRKWHDLTRNTSLCGDVKLVVKRDYNPEILSRGWLKLYEILALFDILPIENLKDNSSALSTVHLCEAPGAFVAALNHYLACNHPDKNWDWVATTLNPYYEGNDIHMMINEDKLIRNTLSHWTFLGDHTGNIMDRANIDSLTVRCKQLSQVLLVTADGSIDCQNNPGEQEITVSRLHFAEIVAALCVLEKGGSFVVKIFTIFECPTICNIYLLMCTFREVILVKPATSGDGNSEVYIVCKEYYGAESIKAKLDKLKEFVEDEISYSSMGLFGHSDIPQEVIDRIYDAANFFASQQIMVIERNIQWNECNFNSRHLGPSKTLAAEKWIELTNLQKISGKRKLVRFHAKHEYKRCTLGVTRDETRSYHQRQLELRETNMRKMLLSLLSNINRLSDHKYMKDDVSATIDGIKNLVLGGKEKVYTNIANSRFCLADLMVARSEFQSKLSNPEIKNILRVTEEDHKNCSKKDVNSLIIKTLKKEHIDNKNNIDFEVLCFHETLGSIISKTDFLSAADSLEILLRKIKSTTKGISLFFCEFPLLTRLHVGCVIVCASFFEMVKLCVNQEIDLSGVLFINCTSTEKNQHAFDILDRIIVDLKCEERSTLSIIPSDSLKEEQLEPIIRYNSMNLHHNLRIMIKKTMKFIDK